MNVAAPAAVLPISEQIVQPAQLIANPHPDRLFIEARFGTDPAEERDAFREAHVHGAVHAQIRDVFAGPETATSGSLPLPDIDALRASVDAWNVGTGTQIIVYGPSPALAARGWWVLRWAGLENVRVLDGGLRAWELAGGALAQGDAPPRPPRRTDAPRLTPGNLPSIGIDEVEAALGSVSVIDARDETAYRSGCIPGALNVPAADQWTPSGLVRSAPEILAQFESAGIGPRSDVIVYCGGGVLSAFVFMMLQGAGANPRLFVGSWSQWSRYRERMGQQRALPAHAGARRRHGIGGDIRQ